MSLYQDRQIKGFLLFLTLFALLFVGTATVLTIYQVNDAEVLWLKHDEAVSSSLLEQGVPKEVVAVAFTNTDISDDGRSLLSAAGLGKQSESSMRPYFNQFQRSAFCTMLCTVLFFLFVLAIGIFIFFWKRKRLYQQADKILLNYINGDYSCHLPQNYEGAIYQVFSSIEQLATMLQSKNETERKAKEFLKDTISDISHQLKTPLAALTMYQEIIESEPENAETVKQFAAKMGISLKRMEQLILSMLKITRLDTGNIIFEKKSCRVSELIAHSVNDLTTRAKSESKQIQIDGDGEQQLICDMEWTGEAIGNIVKNALDHTQAGGIVRITWERTPAMFRIFISDNGNGIVPEDIYHIFKRFYRSKHSLDTQGIGLGLEFMQHTLTPLQPWTADLSIISPDNACAIDKALLDDLKENPVVDLAYGRKFAYEVPSVTNGIEKKMDLISYEQYQFDWAKDYLLEGSLESVQTDLGTGLIVYNSQNTIQIGDTVSLNTNGQSKEIQIVGMLSDCPFYSAAGVGTIICSEDTFEQITGESKYTVIDVQLVKGTTDEDVYVIRQMVDSSFTFADERMGNSSTMGTYYCFWLFIYGFLVLIAMITIFNIINSISMSVSARLKQYGAFRAIGVSMGQLSKMIVAEAFTYTIIGGVVGTVLGLFCNKLLFGMLISYRWGDAWTPPLPEVAVILLIVISSVILAVHGPIKRIRNMSIVDTISAQ